MCAASVVIPRRPACALQVDVRHAGQWHHSDSPFGPACQRLRSEGAEPLQAITATMLGTQHQITPAQLNNSDQIQVHHTPDSRYAALSGTAPWLDHILRTAGLLSQRVSNPPCVDLELGSTHCFNAVAELTSLGEQTPSSQTVAIQSCSVCATSPSWCRLPTIAQTDSENSFVWYYTPWITVMQRGVDSCVESYKTVFSPGVGCRH